MRLKRDINDIDQLKSYFDSKYFKSLRDSGVYFWFGGGAIRNWFLGDPPRDIDIYFRSAEDRQNQINYCLAHLDFDWVDHKPLTISYLQAPDMRWDFNYSPGLEGLTPETCLKYMDYTICMCALDSNLNLYYHQDFFEHLSASNLHYTGNCYHISHARYDVVLLRMKKYRDRGYVMSESNFDFWLECNEARWPVVTGGETWSPILLKEQNIKRL